MSTASLRAFLSTLVPSGVVTLLLLGCPTDDPLPLGDSSSGDEPMTTTGSPACVPGQQTSCPCVGGGEGVQACLPDGSGFGPCECEPSPLDEGTSSSTTTEPVDSSTTATEPGDSSTTAVETGTTGTTDTGGSDSTTGDEPSVCDVYQSPPGVECDTWLQDCPAGEKCMPWSADGSGSWDSWRCSPIDPSPDQLGDPCTVVGSGTSGVDSCDLGLMCWDVDPDTNQGTCNGLCNGCPDEASCETVGDVCVNTNDGFLPICLPGCDPLVQDCPDGQACYPVADVFLCAPDASGRSGLYGDVCAFINTCDPGLMCLGAGSVPGCGAAPGCCSEICDITDPAGDAQCSGAASGQTCQPWYAAGTAPPGYEDVGACSL